jgi:ParB/RepB/Spo0J family partition protein
MELEVHQIRMRYQGLRITVPSFEARLMASLASEGQLHPVLVVPEAAEFESPSDYVLIDGYRRVQALTVLGRDTVEGVVLPLSESAALLYRHCQESAHPRTALEDGWLLRELLEAHGMTQAELSRHLQRSESWVSRRLSLVRTLPSSAQELVRRGSLCGYGAMKYLVPLARAKKSACEALVRRLSTRRTSTREMGQIYECWRRGDSEQRRRVEENPVLFLKASEAVAESVSASASDTPIKDICDDFEIIEAVSRRVRRRIRGCGESLPLPVIEGWRAAEGAMSILLTTMEAHTDAGSRDTGGDPTPQKGRPRDSSHRAGAEGFAEHGEEGAGGGALGGTGLCSDLVGGGTSRAH